MRVGRLLLGLLACASTTGCYDWRAGVVHAAGFEHHCPDARVRILGDDGDAVARSVHLDVCGEERTYRDIGGARAYVWVDATATVRDGSRRADPSRLQWSDSEAAQFLQEANASVMTCVELDSIAVAFTIDARGRGVAVTSTDPEVAPDQLACIGEMLYAVQIEGVGAPRLTRGRFRRSHGPSATPPPPSAVAVASFPDVVRARIASATRAVLACMGTESAAIEAVWQSSGQVALGVRGSTDSAVDDCVRVGVGAIDVPSGTEPGRLLHAVAR